MSHRNSTLFCIILIRNSCSCVRSLHSVSNMDTVFINIQMAFFEDSGSPVCIWTPSPRGSVTTPLYSTIWLTGINGSTFLLLSRPFSEQQGLMVSPCWQHQPHCLQFAVVTRQSLREKLNSRISYLITYLIINSSHFSIVANSKALSFCHLGLSWPKHATVWLVTLGF